VRDAAQEIIVGHLEQLQQELASHDARSRGILARWRRRAPVATKGLYIWGGVGRGKTFLMDLFYETLPIERKRRVHFHRMMQEVHQRLTSLHDEADPLEQVARDIAGNTCVLCFDEFFVSDIADAMILGRLLDGLFSHGVTLVTTSNSPPAELYNNGLQRERFLPAIDRLNEHTCIIELDGGTDYRLRLLQQAGTYLYPNDEQSDNTLTQLFDASASSQISSNQDLQINGRPIRTRHCAKGIVWFAFDDICDGPRSQSDYIELARWYPQVIVSGIPVMSATTDNQARRFIALVDEFYDRRVKLIVAAENSADQLYVGKKLAFEFERTSSRLVEMQSDEYLSRAHLCD